MKFIRSLMLAFVCIALFPAAGNALDTLGIDIKKTLLVCNVTPEYLEKHNDVAHGGNARGGPNYTAQADFHSGAIITCGKFRVYYEDMQQGTGDGWDDPVLGADRRNTLCAVLTYVQNTVNINVNGTTNFIDIYMERSFTPANPAGVTETFLANAGPYFPPGFGSAQQIYNGHFFDHAVNGTDPEAGMYDAHIETNFHQSYNVTYNTYIGINYWNDYLNTSANCCFDLYTVMLHEVTHAMGFLSLVVEDPNGTHPAMCGNGGNSFSRFDNLFLYHGDPCTMTFTKVVQGNVINPGLTTVNPLRSNKIWTKNSPQPVTQPIYSGTHSNTYPLAVGSVMSHLNLAILSFTGQSQTSPGYQPRYVMGPSVAVSQRRRTWTIPELRILMELGYGLNPAFAASNSIVLPGGSMNNGAMLSNNTPPYRTNCATPVLTYYLPVNFMELMATDFSLTNNNTPSSPGATTLTINVNALPNITDNQNASQIYVAPGSLFGIRGVSNGANNHACLQLNANGSTITYTPVPGFHGRAQFGFYLSDGNERGALRIVSIDVSPGSYTLNTGDQMVVNSDLEDGTEVRQRVINPGFEYTQYEDFMIEGVYSGRSLSGGHNFNFLTNHWDIGGGDVVERAWNECALGVTSQYGQYGTEPSEWSTNSGTVANYPVPTPGPGTNQRYHHFQGQYNYSTLINPVEACNVYHFECDLNFEKTNFVVGQTFQFQLQFVNNPFPSYHTELYYTAPVQVTVTTVTPDTWQHISFDFQYCGTATPYMNLLVEGIVPPQVAVTGTGDNGHDPLTNTFTYQYFGVFKSPFIDNISLEKATPAPGPVTLAVTANPSSLCNPGQTTLNAVPTNYLPCNATYSWMPGSLTGNSVTTNVATTTTFTAQIDYACNQRVTAPVTVTVAPPATIAAMGPFCVSNSTPQAVNISPAGGTLTGNGVSFSGGIYYFTPSSAGVGSHTLTYSYTAFPGCIKTVTTTVQVMNQNISLGVNGPFCVNQGPLTLAVTPAGGTWTGTGISGGQFNPSVAGTGTFTLTYTLPAPCNTSLTTSVVVAPAQNVTITPVAPLCRYASPVTLTVSQGSGTFSGPGVSGNQFNPLNANIGNNVITWTGTSGGCTLTTSITIVVIDGAGPASWPKFISGATSRSVVHGVVTDGQGNVYITGYFANTSAFTTFGTIQPLGFGDMFIAKYNEQCGGQWIRTIGASGAQTVGRDITIDSQGNLYVTGDFLGTSINFGGGFILSSQAASEVLVMKLDNNGNTLWVKQSTSPNPGSLSTARGQKVHFSSVTGSIYVEGTFYNTVKFGTQPSMTSLGNSDVFVARYTTSGTEQWTAPLGSAYASKGDYAGGLGTDASGNLYVATTMSGSVVTPGAFSNSVPGTSDLFIAKYSAANVFLIGTIRGNSTADVGVNDMVVESTGRCYLTGAFTGALPLGVTLNSANQAIFIALVPASLNTTGAWAIACATGSGSDDVGHSIATIGGILYVSGTTNPATSSFAGFSPSTVTGTSTSKDVFVCSLSTNGAPGFLQFSTSVTKGNNHGYCVAASSAGTAIVGGAVGLGSATTNVSFNSTLTPATGEQGFVSRCSSSGAWFRMMGEPAETEVPAAEETIADVTLFPNPGQGEFTIMFRDSVPADCRIEILDATGRLLDRRSFRYEFSSANTAQVHMPNAANGMYFVEIISESGITTKKLLISK